MKPCIVLPIAATALLGPSSAQARFTPLATIDLASTANAANPEFIGSNPSAIAWDGTDLWVAGTNGAGMDADVGIVKITDALGAATFGTSFGVLDTPNLRGYSGLDVTAAGLAAAYDDGGSSADGITLWDASGTRLWAKAGRGGSGVAFDPGFGGAPGGAGVAWTTFGSGRRALQDAATGADVFTSANGMIILTPEGSFWRDMDFDDDTGDVYLREGNNLIRWTRSGDNAVTGSQLLFDPMDSDFINGQNVAFLGGDFDDYVLYNDRHDTGPSQPFAMRVFLVTPTGAPVTVDWGGFAPPDAIAHYDFSWHAPTRTLAISDFSNRAAYLLELDGGIGSNFCLANANSTGQAGTMGVQGSSSIADNSVTLTASGLPQNAFSFFITARNQGFVANPSGSQGNLCLSGSIGRYVGPGQIQNSGATGAIALAIDLTAIPQPTGLVAAASGETWNFQAWHRDAVMGVATSNFTDGAEVTFQ